MSVVPQQIDLFSGTIIDNIAIGDSNPELRRIIEICQELGILEFIEKLPSGFSTILGERGIGLSGGQKQRLAIARALYREPEILILDEATSALDNVSEQYVQRTIKQLKNQGKTIIIIAHRLTTIMNSDNILVLSNGKLVQEGNHKALLSSDGLYQQLWYQSISATVKAV